MDVELQSNQQLFEYLVDLWSRDKLPFVSLEELDRFRQSGLDRSDVQGKQVHLIENALVHHGILRGPAEHIAHALCEVVNGHHCFNRYGRRVVTS